VKKKEHDGFYLFPPPFSYCSLFPLSAEASGALGRIMKRQASSPSFIFFLPPLPAATKRNNERKAARSPLLFFLLFSPIGLFFSVSKSGPAELTIVSAWMDRPPFFSLPPPVLIPSIRQRKRPWPLPPSPRLFSSPFPKRKRVLIFSRCPSPPFSLFPPFPLARARIRYERSISWLRRLPFSSSIVFFSSLRAFCAEGVYEEQASPLFRFFSCFRRSLPKRSGVARDFPLSLFFH